MEIHSGEKTARGFVTRVLSAWRHLKQ